eukprot:TRINITY_DN395_c0_g1_i1.p1 TRINITY_DN395_c0_g1~~TRINITY_DN395_c0_g1_i1.p1  ORF type:complete len:166 (-),score=33.45 TRINITY_DN395_c0_g1_i1:126-623(-)
MIIYKDVITGDEVLSDAFPMKEIDDVILEVETKSIIKKDGEVVPNNSDTGESLEDGAVTVNNVVEAHNLQETQFGKKPDYLAYLKGYFAAVTEHLKKANPSRVEPFKKAAQTFVTKKLLPKFSNLQFFTGSSMEPTGHIALMWYPEGKLDPIIWVWKDGLKSEKV